jgi:hypothetical protein
MNKSTIEIKALYLGFCSEAAIGCGLSDVLYQCNLDNIITSYRNRNDVSAEFIEFGEEQGYMTGSNHSSDDECSHGISYGCCPAGCENPQEIQNYIDSMVENLIISDDRAHKIHIEFMASFAKVRCGVYDDMADMLVSNEITYHSKTLSKTLPDFSELWEGKYASLAFAFDGNEKDIFFSLDNHKVGFYECILKGIEWGEIYCYLGHRFAKDWMKELKSEIEIAFFESVKKHVKTKFNDMVNPY